MENNNEQTGGLSASHLQELESVIGQILTNQQVIMEQNKDLLSAKKMGRIWGIAKGILIWIVLPLIAVQLMPQLIESMMGQINGVMGDQMQNMVQQQSSGIDPDKASELMQLLGQ